MRQNKTVPVAAAAMAILATAASGATIVDTNATWPGSPGVQTVDANSVTNGGRGVAGARQEYQSFSYTGANLLVDTVYLSAASYANAAFTIAIFEVSDVLDTGTFTSGTQVGSTITVGAFGSTTSGNSNLEISLGLAEQFVLTSQTGPAGYVMRIASADPGDPNADFNLVHSNTGSDLYGGGTYLRDDGGTSTSRDFGLALTGVVPEPSVALLGGLGVLGLLRRRRH